MCFCDPICLATGRLSLGVGLLGEGVTVTRTSDGCLWSSITHTDTHEGPFSWMQSLDNHWPMSTQVSRLSPLAIPARNPPAKASPAPLVSEIWELSMAWTGNCLTSSSP